MDFEFSEDQLSLRDAVARWVDKGFGFDRRHALAKAGGASRAVYTELAELGLSANALARALDVAATTVRHCKRCRMLTDGELCVVLDDLDPLPLQLGSNAT